MRNYTYMFIIIIILISASLVQASSTFTLIYVVQDGDTLSEIAENYGIKTRDLMEVNNLNKNSLIKLGQDLIIPVRRIKEEQNQPEWNYQFENYTKSPLTELKLQASSNFAIRVNPGNKLPEVNIPANKIIKYHVGRGDTLYDLSRSFNTSIGIIMALNTMDNSIIRVGDIIKLPINNLTPRQALSRTVKSSDIELLARAIYGEARGEPFIGQVAVGAVIINRVLSSYFPNTFQRVIYQKNQFSAVSDGQINLKPNQTAYNAAREALKGTDPTIGAMYYYNPKIAKHQWWFETRRMLVTIGDHVFTK